MATNHVILPKTTLNQFSKSGKIAYLNLKDKKIHYSTAKSFNTKENYYPDETEKFLSSEIETSIGRIRVELDNFAADGKETFVLTPEFQKSAFECVLIQLMRRPSFMKEIREKSIFKELNVPDEFFSGLHRGKKYIDIAFKAVEKSLSKYAVTICTIDQNQDFSFILPSAHGFSAGNKMFFVVSPYRSVVLLPKEDLKRYAVGINEEYFYYTFENYQVLESVYKKAMEAEEKDGVGKIVGLESQLKRIQNMLYSE